MTADSAAVVVSAGVFVVVGCLKALLWPWLLRRRSWSRRSSSN
jgi:hypothetical protein